LCRYIVRLVEAKDEKIGWVILELANAGTIIYQLWPRLRRVLSGDDGRGGNQSCVHFWSYLRDSFRSFADDRFDAGRTANRPRFVS
jgi:hypothetical protein